MDYSIEVSIPNRGPVGPQGEVGPVGPANELTLGEITTGDPGTEAEATISGTPPNQVLDLVLPRGDTGAQGNPGPTGAGGAGVVPAPVYATMQEAVEDGITFGGVFRHTSGSVFWVEEPDPDAATFIAASGATDVWNLQKFVQGVKALGLWDNMVCWPLRSSQNKGSGTTAYSLGGLVTLNGTLTNGPTWGADGVTFDGSNDFISAGVVPIAGADPRTLMTVSKSSTGGPNMIAEINNGGGVNNSGWGIFHFPNNTTLTSWGFNSDAELGTVTSGVFSSAAFGYAAQRFGFLNGQSRSLTTANTAPATGSNSQVRIGASRVNSTTSHNWFFNGQIAFVAIFASGTNTNIHDLYKTTLGIGLNLP